MSKQKKSLSPVGLTMPVALKRLESLSSKQKRKDAEAIMMLLWENENTRDPLNGSMTPLDSILHECTEGCGKTRIFSFGADKCVYKPSLNERDVKVAAATIQWIATNCGRSFFEKFYRKFEEARKSK
ncbi:MAG: hypothetical protein WC629_01710 [Candidatus Paceibacterota bacterium]|jgi:hypothetical protein